MLVHKVKGGPISFVFHVLELTIHLSPEHLLIIQSMPTFHIQHVARYKEPFKTFVDQSGHRKLFSGTGQGIFWDVSCTFRYFLPVFDRRSNEMMKSAHLGKP